MFVNGNKSLALVLLIQLLAIILFMRGLWPMKKRLTEFGRLEDLPSEPGDGSNDTRHMSGKQLYPRRIHRLVFVVVDALRFDFVSERNFPFVGSLLRERRAILVKARAHLPTVTLPRIKTMTSGGIPAYTDVILNFQSNEFVEDNFVEQAHRNGMKIVFYGDESWLGLFPRQFVRYEGTTSFFVTDFYEVDTNVTRHLSKELRDLDWDVLILHYLGLDHIGHAHGPFSSYVEPKLNEMDFVIKDLFTALKDESKDLPSLLVVCGDHGMSDYGSHGGSSESETLIPLIFAFTEDLGLGKDPPTDVEFQTSLASTLSVLLGLPIPVNNLGPILASILNNLTHREQLYVNYLNALQMVTLMNASVDDFVSDSSFAQYRRAFEIHAELVESGNFEKRRSSEAIDLYREVTRSVSMKLMATVANQDVYLMIVATILLWQVHIFLLQRVFAVSSITNFSSIISSVSLCFCVLSVTHVCMCVVSATDSQLCAVNAWNFTLILGLLLTVAGFVTFAKLPRAFRRVSNTYTIGFALGWWLHAASFFASSFVEEEHQTWYFLTTSLYLYLLYETLRSGKAKETYLTWDISRKLAYATLSVVLWRCIRSWNQTGDKWAHQHDVKWWLSRPENQFTLHGSIVVGLIVVYYVRSVHHSFAGKIVILFGFAAAFVRQVFPNVNVLPISPANCVFLAVVAVFLEPFIVRNDRFNLINTSISALALLHCNLFRSHNILLLALILLHEKATWETIGSNKPVKTIATYYCLGMASFFYLGNSNSLARIDVAAGYVGQSQYNPVVTGLLLWSHTYAGLCFWILSLMFRLQTPNKNIFTVEKTWTSMCDLLALSRSLPVAMFVTSNLLQRHHLFIWSVFSPKLLFEGMHTLFFAVIISLCVAVTYVKRVR